MNILEEEKKGKKEQPSTGVVEEGGQVLVKATPSTMGVATSTSWSKLKNLGEEASMVIQWIHELSSNTRKTPQLVTPRDGLFGEGATSLPPLNLPFDTAVDHQLMATSVDGSNPSSPTSSQEKNKGHYNCEDILSVFQKAMETEDWDKVKHSLENSILLNNRDTGGHDEFLDLQAALLQSSSLNLFFRRLIDNLNKDFEVSHTNKDGSQTEKEDSFSTVKEVLFQVLASVASFCDSFSEVQEAATSEATLQATPATTPPNSSSLDMSTTQSRVMIVGTHRDLVSEEEFKEEDKLLKEELTSTAFYENEIVQFESEDQLMLAVDNKKGDMKEIKRHRATLEKVIKRCFKKVKVPASWLALSLYMRSLNKPTLTLAECERMASKVGISPSELQHVLWFLHHRMGVLLYFPKALKNTVICEMRVVFASTTNLIENTLHCDTVGRHLCKKFKETGRFSLDDVKRAASSHTNDLIPPKSLVELLHHLNILTTIPNEPSYYFMPCVLKSARASELASEHADQDPAPLMIRYNCGYTPIGLFPSMIANLVSNPPEGWEILWEGICKNRVQFIVGIDDDRDNLTLLSHPRFIKITLSRDHSSEFCIPIEQVCANVRSVIESTLKSTTSRMNSNFKMGYKFGFDCPTHPGMDHLCVLSSERAAKMQCLQTKENVKKDSQHKVWFTSTGEHCKCKIHDAELRIIILLNRMNRFYVCKTT